MIERFTVARDEQWYCAWPDVVRTGADTLLCIYSECTHHKDRSYTRIMLTDSADRGRTWSTPRPLTEGTDGLPFYNCPRLSRLRDGRVVSVVDTIHAEERSIIPEQCRNELRFSSDGGVTWTDPVETPALGIVPDKLIELDSGRRLLACHCNDTAKGRLVQRVWYTDDEGETWSDPVVVGDEPGCNLCEASILPIEGDTLVAFMRENSFTGRDCYKAVSRDGGEHWDDVVRFPLPGCHRPVAGLLQDGRILVTFRFMQGGKGWVGTWTQNFFAALTDTTSALAPTREEAWTRIMPVDFDRSPVSDLGYSGWVQFDDGEIYVVNYVVDDWPRGQIRGYALRPEAFLLPDGS